MVTTTRDTHWIVAGAPVDYADDGPEGGAPAAPGLPLPGERWRFPRVLQETGLSRSTIYRKMAAGLFPASFHTDDGDGPLWHAVEVAEHCRAHGLGRWGAKS